MFGKLLELAKNEAVRNFVVDAASNYLQSGNGNAKGGRGVQNIEVVSSSKLSSMKKIDARRGFCCYSDEKTIHVLAELPSKKQPSGLSVWRGEFAAAQEIAARLEPFSSVLFDEEDAVRRKNVEVLMRVVLEECGPDWRPIHIAAAAGVYSAIDSITRSGPDIVVNTATARGELPLQLALSRGHALTAKKLLAAGAQLHKADSSGRTALHAAAGSSSLPSLKVVLECGGIRPSSLDSADGEGWSALAEALKKAWPEGVRLLVEAGAKPRPPPPALPVLFALSDVQYSSDLETCLNELKRIDNRVIECKDNSGRSIFHSNIDGKVVGALLSVFECDMTSSCLRDSAGFPALLAAASGGHLDRLLALLSHGASVDDTDSDGNTALHLAVQEGKEKCVKALLLFGAKSSAINRKTNSVADVCRNNAIADCLRLVDWKSPVTVSSEFLGELEEWQLCRALSSAKEKGLHSTTNLLSLDGGGIRGLVLIELLAELERVCGGEGGVMRNFSWLGGTSTGAILALALSKGYSIAQCRRLYFRFKDLVFSGRRPYNPNVLEQFLKREFGADTKLSSLRNNKVVVTTCVGNISPPELHLFRNYELPLSPADRAVFHVDSSSDSAIWYAARCSSAAPTYFEPVAGRWMDGGLVANNPVLEILSDFAILRDASQLKEPSRGVSRLGVVVSLGTGRQPVKTVDKVQLSLPDGFGITSILGAFENAKHFLSLFVEQLCRADGAVVDRARAWCASESAAFFRFTPSLKKEIALDATDNDELIDMMWDTRVYMRSQSTRLKILSEFLAA